MKVTKIEQEAYVWWLSLKQEVRVILRFLICLMLTLFTGMIHLYLEKTLYLLFEGELNELLQLEPGLFPTLFLAFCIFFLFSIMLTRMAKDKMRIENLCKELKDANEELQKANEEVSNKSLYDPLTGIRSRLYFNEVAPAIETEAYRHSLHIWAIMLDLDKFKYVNDTHGHLAGDKYICYFAAQLKQIAKRKGDHFVRLGGDEFLIFGSSPSEDTGEILAAMIIDEMDSWSIELNGSMIKVTASLGVASAKYKPFAEVIDDADVRMYAMKQGRNKKPEHS